MNAPKIPYPGAKGKLAPTLVEMMPSHGRLYMEPFVGRGNVFFAAALSLKFKKWHLNDISTSPFFKALIKTDGYINVPDRTKNEFKKQKLLFQKDDARAILLEPYLTFSGGGYAKAGFGGLRSANATGYTKTLIQCATILRSKKAKITNLDWKRLDLRRLTSDDFVFLDPPYYGADVRAYSNEFDHAGMIKMLLNAKFRWMLTEYEQEFYLKAFGEPCFRKEMQLACDGGRGKRRRTECVWTNYNTKDVNSAFN